MKKKIIHREERENNKDMRTFVVYNRENKYGCLDKEHCGNPPASISKLLGP